MEDKQHKVKQLAEHGEEMKKLRAAISVANEKAAAVIPDDTPEKQAVLKLQKQQPDWRVLRLSDAEAQFVMDVWISKDTHGEQAKEILLASAKAWKDKHTTERQKRLNALEEINKLFEQGSAEVFATLSLKGITPEETDPVLTAVSKIILLLGPSRAVIGKNFTNSVGIEMVWIPDGKTGFWIGRSEVSTAAYKAMRGGGPGDDRPAEKISFNDAIELVGILNNREAESKNIVPPGRTLRPLNAIYTIPTVKQWRVGRVQEKSFGMEGFSNGLSEWSQDRQSSGLSTETAFLRIPDSSWPIALNGDSAIALPPHVSGNYVTVGPGTIATGKGGTVTHWRGRLGLRVILVPKKE
ncbi:hypothetical protein [Prosthecobacter sp.]|uniref:hypothetical protein n=1 Tax=Prosthecobacter sp. TaxID=1965333 RepID=UPI003782EE36